MSAAVIDRVLADAQKYATQGRRDLALELIVLALDVVPDDPSVLLRAQQIRSLLPATAAPHRQEAMSHQGENRTIGLALPDPAAPVPVFAPAPALGGDDADGVGGSGDDPAASLPQREVIAQTLQTIASAEEDARAVREAAILRRRMQTREARHRAAARGLWALLVLGLVVSAVGVVHPTLLTSLPRAALDAFDPVVKGEAALAAGDLATAQRYAERVQARSNNDGRAHLFLAKAAVGERQMDIARAHAVEAVTVDSAWATAIVAGRLLEQAHDLKRAADVYLLAFDRGAPSSRWREIVRAQVLADQLDRGENLLGLLKRSEPDAATLTLEALRGMPPARVDGR